MTLGDKLKYQRTRKGIKQYELSDILCVSRASISHWESDRSRPNYEELLALCAIFEVSVEYMIGGMYDKKSINNNK